MKFIAHALGPLLLGAALVWAAGELAYFIIYVSNT